MIIQKGLCQAQTFLGLDHKMTTTIISYKHTKLYAQYRKIISFRLLEEWEDSHLFKAYSIQDRKLTRLPGILFTLISL